MIHRAIEKLVVLAVFGSVAAMANSIVYINTSIDTFDTVFYSVGPYSELGDQIHLAGTDRLASAATVQFFNNGDSGTFDATLRLYEVGSPVGAQIGSDFIVTGVAAPAGTAFDVTFLALNVTVPGDLIFTVSESSVSGSADIGVDLFEPPTIGTSDSTFMIDRQSSLSQLATSNEDVFFQLDAAPSPDVPEPGGLTMLGCGISFLLAAQKRRREQVVI